MESILQEHFDHINLDIRQQGSGYSRFMDQKVTPDVLSFIADCVINYADSKDSGLFFTVKDIWNFSYFQKNTVAIFGKPSPANASAKAEYNKFIGQPLKTLAFAQVLEERKQGNRNTYRVVQEELLNYIAKNERNAWLFLVRYVEKVLTDSGFIKKLDAYKEKALLKQLGQEDFDLFKKDFALFMRGYTNINTDVEIRRIFPKILNPYAAYYMINGTEDGRMTENRFIYSDLMYNRGNFRDLGKDKALTRGEAEETVADRPELFAYKVLKAKGIIKRNHPTSELRDSFAAGEATQAHHIFPEHEFPQISAYLENLILLTAQQHNTKAHPGNNNRLIDRDYQRECLLSKIDSIEASLNQGKDIYSKESFIHVLNIGYGLNLSTNTTFDELRGLVKGNRT